MQLLADELLVNLKLSDATFNMVPLLITHSTTRLLEQFDSFSTQIVN